MKTQRQRKATFWAAALGRRVWRRPNPEPDLSDDWRWGTLGNPEIRTPNLDGLAGRGFHFGDIA